jgi:hypothetical protein
MSRTSLPSTVRSENLDSEVLLAVAEPERLIGTIGRECLDHMIVFGEAQLRRISMSKSAKKRSPRPAHTETTAAKPSSLAMANPPRPHKADPGTKQSRVIAMLQSPASTGPIPSVTANQLTRALGEAVIRIRSNLPQAVQLHLFQEAY